MKPARYAPALLLLALTAGCNEYSLATPPPVAPAEPPGKEGDDAGEPPDWQDCFEGFHGEYFNLSVDDDWVAPRRNDPPAPTDPDQLDYWSEPSFQRFDPSLDMGTSWWPVDEGLEDDPRYYAVRWRGWIRAWSGTDLGVAFASAGDAWVRIDDEIVIDRAGLVDFDPEEIDVPLDAGQYPIEILYAHRQQGSGFRFRVTGGDVTICYPEWGGDDTTTTTTSR